MAMQKKKLPQQQSNTYPRHVPPQLVALSHFFSLQFPRSGWPSSKLTQGLGWCSGRSEGSKVPKWPPPDAPRYVGGMAVGFKLSSCRSLLPPAATPPGKAKQPQVTFAGATTTLQPCSVLDSHAADFIPRREHTWGGDTAALKPTPVSHPSCHFRHRAGTWQPRETPSLRARCPSQPATRAETRST